MMTVELYNELELLCQRIETNTAKLADYQRYELLLTQGGLNREYIFSYLQRAGFNSWQELINARESQKSKEILSAVAIGGLVGLGLGLILSGLFSDEK